MTLLYQDLCYMPCVIKGLHCYVSQPLTSEVNILAHVPMHQATTGLVTRPSFMALVSRYSSIPPT